MDEAMSKRIRELCSSIAVERDHKKFLALVQELNRILAERGKDLEDSAGRTEN
jgi:hypothetical protein